MRVPLRVLLRDLNVEVIRIIERPLVVHDVLLKTLSSPLSSSEMNRIGLLSLSRRRHRRLQPIYEGGSVALSSSLRLRWVSFKGLGQADGDAITSPCRELKPVLDKLPVAAGAAFDSRAEEHNPMCLPGTRVDLLRKIYGWAENAQVKAFFLVERHGRHRKIDQLGASFFFKREGDRAGVSKLFATIAAQLIERQPAVTIYVKIYILSALLNRVIGSPIGAGIQ
ncbi:hypothetical protein ANO14919_095970 [Xylariales sp. No.14919]|nr:hypothetical protein ANO14919_095970 [Xylariales sp. No.14919]